MSKDEGDPSQTPRPRRSSFAELFASRPSLDLLSAQGSSSAPRTSSMASAVTQQAQQDMRTRRLSVTTLGLSGSSPTQPANPFGNLKRSSMAAGGRRSSMDENAVDDEEPARLPGGSGDASGSPMVGRRMSFGARAAYRDMRGSGNGENAIISPTGASPPPGSKGREGFNWSENLRSRAERVSVSATSAPGMGLSPPNAAHSRAKSIATQPAAAPPPPKPVQKAPDHFQERILKGDFYMD